MTELDKLIPALVAFQSAVKAPPKTKINPHLKNKYADLQDVIDTIREPLSANGLAISHEVKELILTTKLLHTSGQFLTTEMPLLMAQQTMQGLGSALTYARRYSVSALLGIASDDCDDANGAGATKTAAAAMPPVAQKQAATATPDVKNAAISQQAKMMFALSNECKWTTETLKAYIKEQTGKDSSKDLTTQEISKIIGHLQTVKEAALNLT